MVVLDGTLLPDSGTVQRTGTLGVAEQEMSADDDRTVGQAVADAIAKGEPERARSAMLDIVDEVARALNFF